MTYLLIRHNNPALVETLPQAEPEAAYREAARRTTSLPERRYLESRAARLG